tara:strand:- start:686 stop:1069 length:384 start_codon:yes stop_codon:yes gene_type:complete
MKNVLLVDDDDQVFQMLSFLLKKEGIQLLRAADGIDAKKLVSTKGGFDLLIVDVFMPRMGGLDFCEFINGRYPVLLISGRKRDEMIWESAPRYDAFLEKDQIKDHLIKAIYKAQERWELFQSTPVAA